MSNRVSEERLRLCAAGEIHLDGQEQEDAAGELLAARAHAARLEKIRAWATHQTCDNFYRTGILDEQTARVCGDPACGSCSAHALSRETKQ